MQDKKWLCYVIMVSVWSVYGGVIFLLSLFFIVFIVILYYIVDFAALPFARDKFLQWKTNKGTLTHT